MFQKRSPSLEPAGQPDETVRGGRQVQTQWHTGSAGTGPASQQAHIHIAHHGGQPWGQRADPPTRPRIQNLGHGGLPWPPKVMSTRTVLLKTGLGIPAGRDWPPLTKDFLQLF